MQRVNARYAVFHAGMANCDPGTMRLEAQPKVMFEMKPCSVYNVAFDAGELGRFDKMVVFREFFGDRIRLELHDPQKLSVQVTGQDTPSSPILRTAFQHLKEPGISKITFNGNALTSDWQDATRSIVKYAGRLPDQAAGIGIPISPKLVREHNMLALEPVKGQRLLYTALELTYANAPGIDRIENIDRASPER